MGTHLTTGLLSTRKPPGEAKASLTTHSSAPYQPLLWPQDIPAHLSRGTWYVNHWGKAQWKWAAGRLVKYTHRSFPRDRGFAGPASWPRGGCVRCKQGSFAERSIRTITQRRSSPIIKGNMIGWPVGSSKVVRINQSGSGLAHARIQL